MLLFIVSNKLISIGSPHRETVFSCRFTNTAAKLRNNKQITKQKPNYFVLFLITWKLYVKNKH